MVRKRKVLFYFKEVVFHTTKTCEHIDQRVKKHTWLTVLFSQKVCRPNKILDLQIIK